jgi:2-polyprenyl-6-methoxyphenol hydroxylase-like FAD-dependent oxidoreductase
LLRQQGIGSVLVEQRADVSWYPRARNLTLRTLEVFRGLGLERQLSAAGSHVSRVFRMETLASPGQEKLLAVDAATRSVDHAEILTPVRLHHILVTSAKNT